MKTVAHWQLIETAPRDGTELLLCVEGRVRYGSFHQAQLDEGDTEPDTYSGWYACDCNWQMCERVEPTLWAPMPESPSKQPEPRQPNEAA